MASIMRYNPTDVMFDDLFRDFFMRPTRFTGLPETQLKMDVSEDDNAYIVHAELPGVKKDDIHISIAGDQVAIGVEVKNEKDIKEGAKLLCNERYFGKMSRAFTLGQDVDEASAQAKLNDGVLELRLPKKASSHAKWLTIE